MRFNSRVRVVGSKRVKSWQWPHALANRASEGFGFSELGMVRFVFVVCCSGTTVFENLHVFTRTERFPDKASILSLLPVLNTVNSSTKTFSSLLLLAGISLANLVIAFWWIAFWNADNTSHHCLHAGRFQVRSSTPNRVFARYVLCGQF